MVRLGACDYLVEVLIGQGRLGFLRARFPVRVDDHTRFMPPTELPMWMNSHERRVAIQLRQLQPKTIVRVFQLSHGAHDQEFLMAVLEVVDETQLAAVFSRAGDVLANVPLPFITAVWLEPKDQTWSLKVEGTLFATSSPTMGFKPRRG